MNAREWFGVVVRVFGLYFIILGISYIGTIFQLFGIQHIEYFDWEPQGAFAICYFLLAVFFVRRADAIVGFSFPAEKSPSDR
jgi:hypothetical protein